MSDLEGMVLVAVGMVLFTIGFMIDFATNYKRHNDELLGGARRFKKNPLYGFRIGADLSNPKARWWCIPGIALVAIGFGVLTFG